MKLASLVRGIAGSAYLKGPAFVRDKTALMMAAENGDVAAISSLLESGAAINAQNNHGVTSLVYAAKRGHLEAVKLLLEHGARTELTGVWGETPLIAASMYGHFEVVKVLVRHGASIWHKNINGKHAIMVAPTSKPEICSFLKDCGSQIVPSKPQHKKNMLWQERLLAERESVPLTSVSSSNHIE